MRRIHRSIEVFDISLMAVVTKAMGAFLVLMLIFMKFYVPNRATDKTAADMAASLSQADKEIIETIRRLGESDIDAAALIRALEEARRKIAAAEVLIATIKRENDALNAQVQRLQPLVAQLQAEIAQLQEEIARLRQVANSPRPVIATMFLTSCQDVRVSLGLIPTSGIPVNLNRSWSVADSYTRTRSDANPPFLRARFEFNGPPGKYYVAALKTALEERTISSKPGWPLKKSLVDCRGFVSVDRIAPGKDGVNYGLPLPVRIPASEYVWFLPVTVTADGIDVSNATADDIRFMEQLEAAAVKEYALDRVTP